MSNEGIMSSRQYIWTLFILFASFAVIQVPGLMLAVTARDCWLAVVLAWTCDVLFGILYAYMGFRFPDQNYIQHSITVWGKYLGRIPGFFLLTLFLIFCINTQYSLYLLVSKLILPNLVPEIVLGISFLLVAYMAKKGIVVIVHFCEAVGPVFFVSLLFLFLLLTPLLKLDSLLPQLTTGLVPILGGTFIILTFLGVCIMMTMFIPLSAKPERGFIDKFIASSLGSFILLVVIVYISGVFGVFQAKQMFYPSLELARIIQIGNFSGRIELIWFIITVTVLLTSSACLLWAFSKGLSQYIGSRDFKPFVYPSALLALILSLTSFNSDIEFDQFIFYVYPIIPTVLTVFELLLIITAIITKKKTG